MVSRDFIAAVKLAHKRSYQIAYAAGIHPSTLSRVITGAERTKPGDPRVLRVAAVLGLAPEECFELDGFTHISEASKDTLSESLMCSQREQQALAIWRLDKKRRVLAYFNERGHWQYEIDLDRCATSAQVLDWIFQIAQKTWATDLVLAALLHALNAVLHPQSTLSGCGHEHGPIDIAAVLPDHNQQPAARENTVPSRTQKQEACSE
jgi:hypothetical protein